MKKREKKIIGRSEYVDFPEWGIREVLARVDTGAKTSALHVEDIEELPRGRVRFHVITHLNPRVRRVQVTARATRWSKVRSSSGHFTKRCFVTATAEIGPVTKTIEVSLVSREDMAYRMLLGREALRRDFVVDVGKQHVFGAKHKAATVKMPIRRKAANSPAKPKRKAKAKTRRKAKS